MTLTAADIRADFDLYDFQTTVTVYRVDGDDGVTGQQLLVKALKRVTTKEEDEVGEGSVPVQATHWHLKAGSDIGSGELATAPKERDIIDDGTQWSVTRVEIAAAGTRYVCEVTKIP